MPQYKLTYFDGRALAEPIRLIFVVAGVKYEDRRVPWEEWPKLKEQSGFGQLPILEIDGVQMTQSFAICRYLARLYNLEPTDPFLAGRCDELMDTLSEVRLAFRDFIMGDPAQSADRKKNLAENLLPKYYKIFVEIIDRMPANAGPFITGTKVTWADLFLANWLEIWEELIVGPELIKKYQRLEEIRNQVFSIPAVKEYLAQRPKTSF